MSLFRLRERSAYTLGTPGGGGETECIRVYICAHDHTARRVSSEDQTRGTPRKSFLKAGPPLPLLTTWLKSLKQWPVLPCPGGTSRKSRRPAAHSRLPRTSSQSPLNCCSVRLDARSLQVSMRVNAVPGYLDSRSSASPPTPLPPPPPAPTALLMVDAFPTGSQEEGSGPEPEAPNGEKEEDEEGAAAAEMRGAKVQKTEAAVMRSARRVEPLLPLMRVSLKDDEEEDEDDVGRRCVLLFADDEIDEEKRAPVVVRWPKIDLRRDEEKLGDDGSKRQEARTTLCISRDRERRDVRATRKGLRFARVVHFF